jgi:hypothetical protein
MCPPSSFVEVTFPRKAPRRVGSTNWSTCWGEGFSSHNIDGGVAKLLIAQSNTLERQARLTSAPSPPLGARGDRRAYIKGRPLGAQQIWLQDAFR